MLAVDHQTGTGKAPLELNSQHKVALQSFFELASNNMW